MIRRSQATPNQSIVNTAYEDHLVPVKGIINDTSPTVLNAVTSSLNFELDNSGAYELRKPLIRFGDSRLETNSVVLIPLNYPNKYLRIRYTIPSKTSVSIYDAELEKNVAGVYLRYYDINNVKHEQEMSKIANIFKIIPEYFWKSTDVVNLPKGNLFPNLNVCLNSPYLNTLDSPPSYFFDYLNYGFTEESLRESILNGEEYVKPRKVVLYYDNENYTIPRWILEIISPEINTVVGSTSATTPMLDFNLDLDRPTAIRDLYNYGHTSCTGILAYIDNFSETVDSYEFVKNDTSAPTFYEVYTDTANYYYISSEYSKTALSKTFKVSIKASDLEVSKMHNTNPAMTYKYRYTTYIDIPEHNIRIPVFASHDYNGSLEYPRSKLENCSALVSLSIHPETVLAQLNQIPDNTELYLSADVLFTVFNTVFTEAYSTNLPTAKINFYKFTKETLIADWNRFINTSQEDIITNVPRHPNLSILDKYNLGIKVFSLDSIYITSDYNFPVDNFNLPANTTPADILIKFNPGEYHNLGFSYRIDKSVEDDFKISISCKYSKADIPSTELTPAILMEHISEPYKIIESINVSDTHSVVLKALMCFNYNTEEVYRRYAVLWERSKDGGESWEDITPISGGEFDTLTFERPRYKLSKVDILNTGSGDLEDGVETVTGATFNYMYTQYPDNPQHTPYTHRPDILVISQLGDPSLKLKYRYKYTVYYVPASGKGIEISRFIYTFPSTTDKTKTITLSKDLNNVNPTVLFSEEDSTGTNVVKYVGPKHIYYNSRLYTYCKDYDYLYVSNVNSYTITLFNRIDLPYGGKVTKVVPWRNYMIIFTTSSVYILTDNISDNALAVRLISSSIGVSYEDADAVVPLLNSIYFKSGNNVYVMVPNPYGYVDNIMNVHCVSSQISALLNNFNTYNIAISDDNSKYILICNDPSSKTSKVFIYHIIDKTWVMLEFPIFVTNVKALSQNDIRIYSGIREFLYDKSYSDVLTHDLISQIPNQDMIKIGTLQLKQRLKSIDLGIQDFNTSIVTDLTPFKFNAVFRQKSSNYSLDKQFVESKIIFQTNSARDVSPINLEVYTDDVHRVATVSPDSLASSVQKQYNVNIQHLGTLGSVFDVDDKYSNKSLKQMFIKYSGKGKTITHVLSGESLNTFKLFSIDYRFRVTPKKQ